MTDRELADEVRDVAANIIDPCSRSIGTPLNLVEMGLLERTDVVDGDVTVRLRLTGPDCWFGPLFADELAEKIGGLEGVRSAKVEISRDLSWSEANMTTAGKRKLEASRNAARQRMRERARLSHE